MALSSRLDLPPIKRQSATGKKRGFKRKDAYRYSASVVKARRDTGYKRRGLLWLG